MKLLLLQDYSIDITLLVDLSKFDFNIENSRANKTTYSL